MHFFLLLWLGSGGGVDSGVFSWCERVQSHASGAVGNDRGSLVEQREHLDMLEFVDFVIENVDAWRRGAHASLNLCSFLKFGLQSLQLGGTAHEYDGLHVGRLEMRILDLLVHIGDNLAGARNDIVDG